MLYAFPSFNHLGALDICVVNWDLIPLERNPVHALGPHVTHHHFYINDILLDRVVFKRD